MSQTQHASIVSEIARVEEEANLILTASVIDNRTSGEGVKGVGTILGELKADGKIEDYDTPENADITNIKFDVSSITLGTGDNEELTATFESGSDNGGYYAQIKGKKYPVSKVNDKIEIGKTEITTNGNSKREIKSVETSSSAVATVQILEDEKDKVKITGVSGGTEGIATATITINYTESISTTITVTVKAKYTVNLYSSSTATNSTSITVVRGEKASEATGYAAPTAPEGQKFDRWVLKTAVQGKVVGADATELLEAVTQNLDVYADFKEIKFAFRSYGTPLNVETYGNTYSLTSAEETIILDINNTPADTSDDVTVADDWKIFYEDSDFLYLIYGDYYPVDWQTISGTSNLIFRESTSDYPYGVYASTSVQRDNLLKYLRNNNQYSWGVTSNGDDNKFGSSGEEYLSWSKLKEAISRLSKLSGKILSVQGTPDIELWTASWNAKGNTKLKVTKDTFGCNIMLNQANSSNYDYYINVSTDGNYNTTANAEKGTGYYDILYFPYRSYTKGDGSSGNAYGYWLASPGSNYKNYGPMCMVLSSGKVSCSNGANCSDECTRPVIAIQKSEV